MVSIQTQAPVQADIKLFGHYSYDGIVASDPGIARYMSLRPVRIPHSFARHAGKQFAKSKVNLVERLANKLMRGGTGEKLGGKVIRTHGKLHGKKHRTIKIVEDAFAKAHAQTKQNPIQMLVKAVENAAPREDTTRLRFGGTSYQLAVDVAPQRRIDLALRNIALAAIMSAFDKKITVSDALSNELVLASQGSADSYAIRRRNETERMAKSSR